MTAKGALITSELLRTLSEAERTRRGWPVHSFMAQRVSCSAIDWRITVEQLMEEYPPEAWPGYYDRSVCSTCHGSGNPCELCGGTGRVCPKCRNLGYVYNPGKRGAAPCGDCDLLKKRAVRRIERFWAKWGLTDEETGWTFQAGAWHDERWDGQSWIVEFRKLAAWLQAWAREPGLDGYHWVAMIDEGGAGNNGIGKSYLGTAVVCEALASDGMAHKWQVAELLYWLRERMAPVESVSYAQWFNALRTYPGILFLDEFGSEKLTDWAFETLVALLTYRAERTWSPTILAGNVKYHELQAVMPWLASRLQEGKILRPDMSNYPDWRVLLKDGERLNVPEEL